MPLLTDNLSTGCMRVPSLPQSYSTVLPAALHTQQPKITECTSALGDSMSKLPQRFSVSTHEKKVGLIMYRTQWMGIQTPLPMVI
jgi:hypothetical protein